MVAPLERVGLALRLARDEQGLDLLPTEVEATKREAEVRIAALTAEIEALRRRG